MPLGRPGHRAAQRRLWRTEKPGNLHAYDVSGCTGLITSGSPVSLSASYTIAPDDHQPVAAA